MTAESTGSGAKASYAKAKVEFDRATGAILTHNDISPDEAFLGAVSRPPSPVPAIEQP